MQSEHDRNPGGPPAHPSAAIVVALIGALVLLWFSPWVFGGRVLAPFDILTSLLPPWRHGHEVPVVHNHFVSDAVTQYLPYRLLAARSFAEDGYVGWNPFVLGGVSQSANTMALSHDWTTQLYRWPDFWAAWHLGRMGQFLIAGLGMFVFLRSRGCGVWVAGALGAAYMFNTEFVSWIYHQWALASFCWMPWLLWALYAARERDFRFAALAAVFLALALLGATLQHAAFILIALGCVWTAFVFDGRQARFAATCLVAFVGACGAGLAAFALEPTVLAYLDNLRSGHIREGLGYAAGLRQPVMMALAWPFTVFPFVLGSVQTLDLSKAFVSTGLSFAFFGSLPVVLAVLGALSRRVPLAAKLLMAAGVLLPLTPLVGVLYQRVGLLWILGGCWASAAWLSTAGAKEVRTLVRWAWRVLAVVVILWVGASAVLIALRDRLEDLIMSKIQSAGSAGQFGHLPGWMQSRVEGLMDYLCLWNPWQLAALAGAALSIWGLARVKDRCAWPGLALLLGVVLQLSIFWWQWTTWSGDRGVYGEPALVDVLKTKVGSSGRLAQATGASADTLFPPNTLSPSGVAISGGYESIHPDGMRGSGDHVWDFPGTTHFLGRAGQEQPDGWLEAWTDGYWVLLENPAPRLGGIATRSGGTIPLLPGDVHRDTLNTMEVALPPGTEGVEIFSNWQRGWKWRLRNSDQWRSSAAGPAKGIAIRLDHPAGTAEIVRLRFEPEAAGWARAVSLVSAITVGVLALSAVRRRPSPGS